MIHLQLSLYSLPPPTSLTQNRNIQTTQPTKSPKDPPMQANPKNFLPQEGTGPAGESLTVARPPDNNGGRATGCPPYSGEGTVSLGALHPQRPPAMNQRTLTDNAPSTQHTNLRTTTDSPLTTPPKDRRTMTDAPHPNKDSVVPGASTSCATVAPAPAAFQSAWTQVVPRHRRKKPKNTKKTRRTDSPPGRREGQPTQVPEGISNPNSHIRARGSHGQSGIEPRSSAETVASSSDKRAGNESQPGTSRGQPLDTRKTFPRTTPKYDDNSDQRRSHPVAHRSNAYWRSRSSRGTDARTETPGPSTSQATQKRDRLDDTISPRGEHKRQRTDRPKQGAGSYAQASQPHLNVAVALVPRTDMTHEEAENIQGQVEEAIFNACLSRGTPGTIAYAPAFEGRAYLSEGVLKLWCTNDQSLEWLQKTVPILKSPKEGAELTLIKQVDIPARVRSALFVPNYEGEVGKLHLVLTCQNPWYKVSTWTLYTSKRIQGRTPGLFLVLGIPKEQIDHILARGRKVAYSTGSIYIRFFTKEGVSDVPPKEAPQSKIGTAKTNTPTTTPRETRTITPTGESPIGSPESSVSTILEEIESVLTEEPTMAPASPPNKTSWEESTGSITRDTAALTLQELLETWAPKADM